VSRVAGGFRCGGRQWVFQPIAGLWCFRHGLIWVHAMLRAGKAQMWSNGALLLLLLLLLLRLL